jgi:hypothetical protein
VSGFFAALLGVHLVCAVGATVLFWLTATARKGSERHRRTGRGFVRLIYAAAAAGGALAVAELVAPTIVRPPNPDATPAAVLAAIRQTRQTMWLVLYALVIIVAPVQHAVAVVAAAAQPLRVRSRLHAVLSLFAIAGSLMIVPAAIAWHQWMFLFLAPIGFIVGLRNLTYASQPFATPIGWQREHLTSTITAGITLHTVFLVFTLSRTLGMTLEGWRAVVPWIAPAVIGLPIIFWLRARWRVR